jgi:putative restriction endonuclease
MAQQPAKEVTIRFWAGVTDNRWFEFVSRRNFDEVNFWQPSARPPFTGLPEGTPFLFKLKRPSNHFVGGGFFVRYTRLPLTTAWDVFGEQNGAESADDLLRLIGSHRNEAPSLTTEIGCTILTNVFYLPETKWLQASDVFASNIMVGRTYDTSEPQAMSLWSAVEMAKSANMVRESLDQDRGRFGRPFLMQARLGQGSFRTLVIDAYHRRCALTGESTLPALEAAHIQPYANNGPHAINNGLLLRSDFHKLFDAGLITIDSDRKIRISGRIKNQYFNGKAYYRLDGQELAGMPDDSRDHPDPAFLRWHNDNRFVA